MDVNERTKASISTLQRSAQNFSLKGDYDNAITVWKKILSIREDANTYNTIGDLYIKKKAQDEAIKFFTQAADRFNADGFYEKAMAVYKKILNIVPFEVNALASLADLYAKKGLVNNAVTYYLKAAEKLSRDRKIDESIEVYNKILLLTPSDIKIKIKVADLWQSKGLSERAANEYASIANIYLERDEFDSSIEFFSKAINMDPQNVASFIGLSNLAEKQNNTERALEFVSKASLFSQNDKDILLKYVQLASSAGKTEDAKNTLSKLILSSPEDISYKKLLGSIHIQEGQPDTAWEELLPFIDKSLQEQNWDGAYELLELFKESFSPPVKQRFIAVYRGKGNIESLTGELQDLAKIYEDQGTSQNALGLYKELAELQPGNVFLKNKIEELEKSLDLKISLPPEEPFGPEAETSGGGQPDEASHDDFQEKRTEAEPYASQGLINGAVPAVETPELQAGGAEAEPAQSVDSTVADGQPVDTGADEEDYESHYAAGIEYKQKGLLDDAIREFQIAAKDPERRVLTSRMIASCYMERSVEFLNPFLSSILNVLTTMAKMKATAGNPAFKQNEIAKGDVTGLIRLDGKRARGTLAISFTEPVIREITKRLLGGVEIEVGNYTSDTTGEITNILTGGGRKILSEKGYKFDMAIPTVISGKDHIISHNSTVPVIIVPFGTEAGNFFIEFCFEPLTSVSETPKNNTKSKKGRVSYI